MSISPVQSPGTDIPMQTPIEPAIVSQNPLVGDSIQSAASQSADSKCSSKWSWSYTKIAVVAIFALGACALAAWVMKVIYRDSDREAEFQAKMDYYRNQLRGSA